MAYQDKMRGKFQKKSKEVKKSTTENFNRKHQTLLTDIRGKWFLNQTSDPKYPIKVPRLSFF